MLPGMLFARFMWRRVHTLWATLIHQYEDELLQKIHQTLRVDARVLRTYDSRLYGRLGPQTDGVAL